MFFTEHALAMSVCRNLGLDPVYETIPANLIDTAKSRANKARPDTSLNKEVVEEYTEAMKRGDLFPAIVVAYVEEKNRYVIAGGNHRHEAALKNKCEEFLSIVVHCNEPEFDILCKNLNAVEGQRLSRQVRVDQAADLVMSRGMSILEVSRALNVPRSAVDARVRAFKVTEDAAKIGISMPRDIATTTLDMISRYSKSDPLFKAAASFVAKRKPSGDELKEINVAVANCSSETAKIALFQKFFEASTAKTTRSENIVSRPVRSNLLKTLTMLETLTVPDMTRCKLQIDTAEVLPLLARLKKGYQDLYAILING